jgi:hypothetical protein
MASVILGTEISLTVEVIDIESVRINTETARRVARQADTAGRQFSYIVVQRVWRVFECGRAAQRRRSCTRVVVDISLEGATAALRCACRHFDDTEQAEIAVRPGGFAAFRKRIERRTESRVQRFAVRALQRPELSTRQSECGA